MAVFPEFEEPYCDTADTLTFREPINSGTCLKPTPTPTPEGGGPKVGHEQMSGLNFYQLVAQAIEAGNLVHIDLNDQKGPRFDQDLRFGSESNKNFFFLVRLLELSYDGPRYFDAHSYRSENEEAVWAFAPAA